MPDTYISSRKHIPETRAEIHQMYFEIHQMYLKIPQMYSGIHLRYFGLQKSVGFQSVRKTVQLFFPVGCLLLTHHHLRRLQVGKHRAAQRLRLGR